MIPSLLALLAPDCASAGDFAFFQWGAAASAGFLATGINLQEF